MNYHDTTKFIGKSTMFRQKVESAFEKQFGLAINLNRDIESAVKPVYQPFIDMVVKAHEAELNG